MSLQQAPPEIQLAVDLIYLLEINHIAPKIALAALELVVKDYQKKLQHADVSSQDVCAD